MTWNEFQQANAGRGWDSARMSREWSQYKDDVAGARDGREDGGQANTEVPTALARRDEGGGTMWFGVGFFAIVVAAVVWFAMRRRKQADGQAILELQQALKLPESTMTEVYLSLDGLEDHPDFPALMDKATAVTEQIDALKAGTPDAAACSRARALADDTRRIRAAFDQARRTLPRN
jgi:cbb3-type cytochrome oxidase subunit 3